jgi:AmmeMemoRadiSam system protein A
VPDSAQRGPVLLAIAREAIAREDAASAAAEWREDWLRERAASFVTLRLGGELRGCIGSVDAHRGLGDDVACNAHAAAYRDARFTPVDALQRARLQVEVSVLSPRCPVPAPSEDHAAAALRSGIDGVLLEFGGRRATFLPQVWEQLPDPVEFLAELRRKAGLPTRFWHPEVKVSRYTVEKFR